ncbi:GNAT family N-acetyltransferase [Lutimonas sp.]|uniref:GNAT family N-acetyltransferase n=1 Tax=Lutimonas sp. TaxID=1872403 RepID=UPI003D9BFD38
MIRLIRTNSDNQDFKKLVNLLDAELAIRDGDDHEFYHQFNSIVDLNYTVVAYKNNEAIGCGALKELTQDSVEIKRMYVKLNARTKGVAGEILAELEKWAFELAYKKCRLETGKKQPEAIVLYERKGYHRIINYGQYFGIENSLCFEKLLS